MCGLSFSVACHQKTLVHLVDTEFMSRRERLTVGVIAQSEIFFGSGWFSDCDGFACEVEEP